LSEVGVGAGVGVGVGVGVAVGVGVGVGVGFLALVVPAIRPISRTTLAVTATTERGTRERNTVAS
jgi:hypothetical protein